MRPMLLPALLLALGCARGPAAPAPARPEAVNHAAGSRAYLLAEHRRVEQQYQGRPILTRSATHAAVTLDVAPAAAGLDVTVTVDSAAVQGDAGVPEAAARGAAGARFTGRLTPDGRSEAWEGPQSPSVLLDQLAFSVRDLIVPLPPGGARPGDQWADTTRREGRAAGLPVLVTAATEYEAVAWTDERGSPTLEVRSRTRYTLEGEGERAGQWLTMTGGGASLWRRLLTADGTLAFGSGVDTLRLTVDVGGTGLTIPVLQARADTIRRVLP